MDKFITFFAIKGNSGKIRKFMVLEYYNKYKSQAEVYYNKIGRNFRTKKRKVTIVKLKCKQCIKAIAFFETLCYNN